MLTVAEFRLVHSLFEHMVPELEDRLAQSASAPWPGVVEIEIEKDKVQLEIGHGRIGVVSGRNPQVRLVMKELYLLQLILGLLSFSEVRDVLTEKTVLDPTQASLLNDLFPRKRVCSGNWG